jgi:hypothetical protein
MLSDGRRARLEGDRSWSWHRCSSTREEAGCGSTPRVRWGEPTTGDARRRKGGGWCCESGPQLVSSSSSLEGSTRGVVQLCLTAAGVEYYPGSACGHAREPRHLPSQGKGQAHHAWGGHRAADTSRVSYGMQVQRQASSLAPHQAGYVKRRFLLLG